MKEILRIPTSYTEQAIEGMALNVTTPPVTRRVFGRILTDKGIPRVKRGIYFYCGLEITDHMEMIGPPGPVDSDT